MMQTTLEKPMNFSFSFLIIFFLGFLPLAQADPQSDAIDAIARANQASDKGDFYKALREYQLAFEITQDPRVAYRIGIVYENLANFQKAREYLERYLEESSDAKYQKRILKKIKNLKKLERTVQASILIRTRSSSAKIFLKEESEEAIGRTPMRVPLGPGSHTFEIKLKGYKVEVFTIELASRENLEREIELQKIEVAADPVVMKKKPEKKTRPRSEDVKPAEGTHQKMMYVKAGPSTGVQALLWSAVGVGIATLLFGSIAMQSDKPSVKSSGKSIAGFGLLSFGAGGYFLWIHRWTDLPKAKAGLPKTTAIGYRISF